MEPKAPRPVKILQYGEGNFLRAFADYMVDVGNEKGVFDGGVQIVKPIPGGSLDAFREQDCVYTVLLRGIRGGTRRTEMRKITCVSGALDAYGDYEAYAALARAPELRFVISNTTEAGIAYDGTDELALTPPRSYPGKLTKLLYERYLAFDGAADKGLIVLPVELIERNGAALRECCMRLSVRWGLPTAFTGWLNACNLFCNTLVDRIVTGYPKDEADALQAELGYEDKLLVAGEPFALWVIESDRSETVRAEFPLDRAGLPVLFTGDYTPYRERKVRLLNGAHTAAVFAALSAGVPTVGEAMADPDLRAFLEGVLYGELSPMVPLPPEEVRSFADSVLERFENPYIRHEWRSIALNSVSKFRVRVLPTIRETYARTGGLPKLLCFSFAAMVGYYAEHNPPDAPATWDAEFSGVPGLADAVNGHLADIRAQGMRAALKTVIRA
jgi:tagaturonate reductase